MKKSYDSYEEKTLINKCKRGDKRAFEELIFRSDGKITASILQLCKQNLHDAQDVKQTTFLKCWKNIDKFRGGSAFSTWAIRIAKNSFFDLYRKRKTKSEVSWEALTQTDKKDGFTSKPQTVEMAGATSGDVVTKDLEEREVRKRVENVIDSLNENHKNVLKLILEDNDITYEEISRKLEIPLGTVMSRIYYARKNLKQRSGERGEG